MDLRNNKRLKILKDLFRNYSWILFFKELNSSFIIERGLEIGTSKHQYLLLKLLNNLEMIQIVSL